MSDPVEDLQKARSALVNNRRQIALLLVGIHPRGKTEEATNGIIQLQKAIEAIDAALADEKALVAKSVMPKQAAPKNPYSEIEDDPSI